MFYASVYVKSAIMMVKYCNVALPKYLYALVPIAVFNSQCEWYMIYVSRSVIRFTRLTRKRDSPKHTQ